MIRIVLYIVIAFLFGACTQGIFSPRNFGLSIRGYASPKGITLGGGAQNLRVGLQFGTRPVQISW